MVRPRLYLETSVVSAYHDTRAPERQRLTQEFWRERLSEYEAVLSSLVLREIADTPDAGQRSEMQGLASGLDVLPLTEEAAALAEVYLEQGIFPEGYRSDALHVAVAVVNGCSYLASWNFRHLVKVRTKRGINLVNALRGYQSIEIVAPPEL